MMNSTSLTCTSSNTASTATGSTAAIRLPNRRKSNSPMFRSPARRVDRQGEPSSLEGQSSLHRPCQEGPRDGTVGSTAAGLRVPGPSPSSALPTRGASWWPGVSGCWAVPVGTNSGIKSQGFQGPTSCARTSLPCLSPASMNGLSRSSVIPPSSRQPEPPCQVKGRLGIKCSAHCGGRTPPWASGTSAMRPR